MSIGDDSNVRKEEGTDGNAEYESFITGSLASVVSISVSTPAAEASVCEKGETRQSRPAASVVALPSL